MVMHVDENDIFVTSERANQVQDIVPKTQEYLTTWKQTLAITGGVVRPIKCSWALINLSGLLAHANMNPLRNLQLTFTSLMKTEMLRRLHAKNPGLLLRIWGFKRL